MKIKIFEIPEKDMDEYIKNMPKLLTNWDWETNYDYLVETAFKKGVEYALCYLENKGV